MAIAPGTTLADHILPARSSRGMSLLRDGLLIVAFSLLMALSAHLSIFLLFTPVPITMQTLVLMLAGASLGSKRGALVMLLYLAEGAVGLPVFALGGGLVHLVGPTAGYLWSYPVAAFVVGWLCEKGLDRSFFTALLAMLPASLIIYAAGVGWLAVYGLPTPHGIDHSLYTAFLGGMLPFIPGDLLKLAIAAGLLPGAWAIVRRVRKDELN
jgi:biotin transport system substrate-specific component